MASELGLYKERVFKLEDLLKNEKEAILNLIQSIEDADEKTRPEYVEYVIRTLADIAKRMDV